MAIKLHFSNPPALMNENELARSVIETAFYIHRKWGPGLLESVYEELMAFHLQGNGFYVDQQKGIPFIEDGIRLETGFRADLIVEHKLIVEIKSIEHLAPVHAKILLTYMRLTNIKLGLLINFGEPLLKNGLKRLINGQI